MKPFRFLLPLVVGGFLVALVYYLVGLLMCITIVGIPWGMQHFKMVIPSIFPFGKEIRTVG